MTKDSANGLKKYLIGVAVTVTGTLLFQTCAFFWWASSITTRVDRNERDIATISQRLIGNR